MNFDFSNLTNPTVLISAVVVVLLVGIAVALAMHEKRKKTEELRRRFGSEYDRALQEDRNSRKAEAKLLARIKRVEHLRIHELTAAERTRYIGEWEAVQARFIDHPRGAVTEADELVNSLLQARGYPVAAFEQRAADISVDHARLVDPYRSAFAITSRAGKNEATTEELRTALIHYRALFEELLQIKTPLETRVLV
jgi:hypothetical protein